MSTDLLQAPRKRQRAASRPPPLRVPHVKKAALLCGGAINSPRTPAPRRSHKSDVLALVATVVRMGAGDTGFAGVWPPYLAGFMRGRDVDALHAIVQRSSPESPESAAELVACAAERMGGRIPGATAGVVVLGTTHSLGVSFVFYYDVRWVTRARIEYMACPRLAPNATVPHGSCMPWLSLRMAGAHAPHHALTTSTHVTVVLAYGYVENGLTDEIESLMLPIAMYDTEHAAAHRPLANLCAGGAWPLTEGDYFIDEHGRAVPASEPAILAERRRMDLLHRRVTYTPPATEVRGDGDDEYSEGEDSDDNDDEDELDEEDANTVAFNTDGYGDRNVRDAASRLVQTRVQYSAHGSSAVHVARPIATSLWEVAPHRGVRFVYMLYEQPPSDILATLAYNTLPRSWPKVGPPMQWQMDALRTVPRSELL